MNWIRGHLINVPPAWITQIAHFAVMYGIVRTFPSRYIAVTIGILAYATWKEFWFDPKEELPKVSGGLRGGLLDFTFLAAGAIVAALGVFWIGGCQ